MPEQPRPHVQSLVDDAEPIVISPQPTGRRLVSFAEGTSSADMAGMIREASGSDAVMASAWGSEAAALQATGASGASLIVERFGIAAVSGDPQRVAIVASALSAYDAVEDVRPEFWMFATTSPPWADNAQATWGVHAVAAVNAAMQSSAIKLAVLDTGIDLGHPDFAGRTIVTESFVPNETVDDLQGHGTHCAGTAASASAGGGNVPRYGVAGGVQLHVGKVLNNRGSGRELDIIAGIEWAVGRGCEIISMSLGRPTSPNEPHDPLYERIARLALDQGCLIVCASGNESDRRYNYIAPVGSPANAPSIMAVAAIGADGAIASFSSGGVGTGAVDIAGPGVNVFSSVPRPQVYKKLSGTSMACPHVAGVAALWAATDHALRGRDLWARLVEKAVPVGGLPGRDVGAGLVQAP